MARAARCGVRKLKCLLAGSWRMIRAPFWWVCHLSTTNTSSSGKGRLLVIFLQHEIKKTNYEGYKWVWEFFCMRDTNKPFGGVYNTKNASPKIFQEFEDFQLKNRNFPQNHIQKVRKTVPRQRQTHQTKALSLCYIKYIALYTQKYIPGQENAKKVENSQKFRRFLGLHKNAEKTKFLWILDIFGVFLAWNVFLSVQCKLFYIAETQSFRLVGLPLSWDGLRTFWVWFCGKLRFFSWKSSNS